MLHARSAEVKIPSSKRRLARRFAGQFIIAITAVSRSNSLSRCPDFGFGIVDCGFILPGGDKILITN